MKNTLKSTQTIFYITIFSLLTVNILLVCQNLQLKSKLESSNVSEVKKGDILSEFTAKNLDNNEVKIKYADRKRIILFFKTTCGYCEKQLKYWKDLVSKIDYQKYKITAVTTETDSQVIKNYFAEKEISNWEVVSINGDDAQKAKLLVTPITLVIDENGVVEKVWTGMWQSNEVDSASKYFAINFFTDSE